MLADDAALFAKKGCMYICRMEDAVNSSQVQDVLHRTVCLALYHRMAISRQRKDRHRVAACEELPRPQAYRPEVFSQLT